MCEIINYIWKNVNWKYWESDWESPAMNGVRFEETG